MSNKSKPKENLGRSLIKNRFGGINRNKGGNSMLHTTEIQDGYDWGRLNLQSITEQSSFQEFLANAELAGTEFQAEKLNIKFVNSNKNRSFLDEEQKKYMELLHETKKGILKIPRRPPWDKTITREMLEQNENNCFLEWRRSLASLQEKDNLILTPYEKNLEFWRQMWRVLERSDIIVQIVDARNPLLFRCEDLEIYVKEISDAKLNILLVNKADLLSKEQREHWATYFTSINIFAVFFSAIVPSANKNTHEVVKQNNLNTDNCIEKITEDIKKLECVIEENAEKLAHVEQTINQIYKNDHNDLIHPTNSSCFLHYHTSSDLYTKEKLINLFRRIHVGPKVTPNVTTVGLIGYPNVGKSSTINALLEAKKVSVSVTPGKTKHFQTIYLDDDILLCDCPGLVMPSFVFTKAEMYTNGILPIDQMRDHIPPVDLICHLIPRYVFRDIYGIILPLPLEGEDQDRCPSAEELLNAYAYNRGFMTANGQPDNARASRYIIKDFVNGKLLYSHAPPNVDQQLYHSWPKYSENSVNRMASSREIQINKPNRVTTSDVDKIFFNNENSGVHIKGKNVAFTNFSKTEGQEIAASNKPWKKINRHQNKKKHEKLRRIYAHLDN